MTEAKRRSGLCSKCRTKPCVKGQAWCTDCKTEHQYERIETIRKRDLARGFSEGARIAYCVLSAEFERLGSAKVTCSEIAEAIRQSPLPDLPKDLAVD